MDFLKNSRFHFIGIGGISMSALAKYLISIGKIVSGSDVNSTKITDELQELGAKIFFTHSPNNIGNAEIVVYNSAILEDNLEYISAIKSGIQVVKRSELLGAISMSHKTTVGIAGSHGKTTATAMIANILYKAGLNPTCFIGGNDKKLSNFCFGSKEYCVYEACEYKSNFLDLSPYLPIVLNVDKDHMDSYGDETEILDAFKKFVGNGISLVNADDANAKNIITSTSVTFGIEQKANYKAVDLKNKDGFYNFKVFSSRYLGEISLQVAGRHNVYNALAAVAVADMLGIKFYHIQNALNEFLGVGRRMENVGKIKGVTAFADYAHHPKELKETLKIFDNPLVIFQPHTYTRTKYLMSEFIESLKDCKNLIIYKTYPARERYIKDGSAKTLYENIIKKTIGNCRYADTPKELKKTVEKMLDGCKEIVFFGAGNIYEISLKLID